MKTIFRRPFRWFALLAFGVHLLTSPIKANDLTPDQRLADFDQLTNLMRSSYGMIELKKQTLGIDLEQVAAAYRQKVAAVQNDNAFYDLLSAFIAEFKDAHLKHLRPSAMSAKLGFSVRRIDGKAVITAVDAKALPGDSFPFKTGDELVSIDGKPVNQLLRERRPYLSSGREESALGKLTRMLTATSGTMGPVPTGIARLAIRPHGSSQVQSIEVPWLVTGRALPGLSFHEQSASSAHVRGLALNEVNPDAAIDPAAVDDASSGSSKETTAPMPAWGPIGSQVISSPLFPAALFESPKGTLAYIRIPTFSPDDTDDALKEFRRVLAAVKSAKGLVLDLADNPGGSVTYGLSIAAMFSDKTLELPKKALRANRTTLTEYRKYEQSSNPRIQAMAKYHEDAIEAAMASNLPLTPPMTLFYRPSQAPDQEVRFTKPLLVLINEQSYSCADLVPAVLQDNHIGKTFGATTAGAGGSVSEYGPLSYSGSTLSLTINVTQRSSGGYIENVGVTPDFPFEPTQRDVATKWSGYRKAYVDSLVGMIP